MRQLKIQPVIYEYDNLKEFSKEFRIGKDDLIITSQKLYFEYLKDYIKESALIFIENYGHGDLSDTMVELIYESVKKITYERIIAIGDDSVLQLGKIFSLKNLVPLSDLFNNKLEISKEKELVLVPAICGIGNEVTNISTLKFREKVCRKQLAVDELYADSAVLIPQLLNQLTFNIFAESSMKTFMYAVETYLSPKANEYTQLFSEMAVKIILNGYKKIESEGSNIYHSLLRNFLLAGNYTGISLSNTGAGILQDSVYKLADKYDNISYADAEKLIFTTVLKKYEKISLNETMIKFRNIISSQLVCDENNIYYKIDELLDNILPGKTIEEYGIEKKNLNDLLEDIMEN